MSEIVALKVFFTWDIHYRCNYNCTYCFLHFEPESANIEAIYLEPEEWIAIWADIYKRYGSCHILVTGGEPFTYPNFIDLISMLSKMHTFDFSTNLSWDINAFIKKVDKERVKIESSLHPEFVRLGEFLRRVNLLRENDYLISVTVVAYPPLLEKIIDYKKTFKKEGIRINIFPYRGPYKSRKYPEEYTESEKGILKELEVHIGTKASGELIKIHSSVGKENTPIAKEKKLCRMGQRYAKIVPNGDAFRCCAAINKDWGKLGNIIKKTFNLLDEPKYCFDYRHCRCYKSMVVGEEERWTKYWNVLEGLRKEQNKEIELKIAKALRNEEKIEEAINKINEILAEMPNNIKALTLLGEIYLQRKDFKASERILQNALKNNSNPDDNSWIYRVLGRLYCELAITSNDKLDKKEKRFSQALEYLTEAVKFAEDANNSVDKAWAHYEIALVYYNQENYSKAQENINIALEHEPEDKDIKNLHSSLLQKNQKLHGLNK